MNLRCFANLSGALLGLSLVGCAGSEGPPADCGSDEACTGSSGNPPSAASTAAASGGAALGQPGQRDGGVAAPGKVEKATPADSCSTPNCGNDGALECVGGQVSRCTRDKNGCDVWQLDQRCAHGCADASTTCATKTSDEDAGLPPGGEPEPKGAPENAQLETLPLAAVAGVYATPPAEQSGLLVSADLGWTFEHRDRIWTLYGDSWPLDVPTDGTGANDALGYMSLSEFANGDSVNAYVSAHPAPAGEPAWHAAAPPLHLLLKEGSTRDFAPMLVERDGMPQNAGNGFAPMTGFSNGRDDERAGAFSISQHYDLVECDAGSCSDGYICDKGLGRDSADVWKRACIVGERSSCMAGPGLCLDQGTTRYNSSVMGRADSTVVRLAVGLMNEADPAHFQAQTWLTRRFYNLTSRTVSDFDASRAKGVGNDYRPAHGNSLERSGVFIWGRTQFGGLAADGRDAQLYLAWVPMPVPDAERRFDWKPRYFAGLEPDGSPRFVERDADSKPLDLDAAASGDQPQEIHDIIGQMSITWLPSVQRFVMFYGGELSPEFLTALYSVDADKVQHDPQGRLFVRFAKQPWGPWTTPRELLAAGDRSDRATPAGLYGPGGILAHDACRGPTCARYEPLFRLTAGNNNGALYAPNFVDTWTVERAEQIDLYWFVSTWNPYQVVLMRTQMTLPP